MTPGAPPKLPNAEAEGGRRGELGWIEWIRQRTEACLPEPGPALQLGIGDDCAVLRPRAGEDLVVTTDFSLEGRHFRRDWHSPESAGHRTLARGLSDLAAMGARPLAAFLSLALPPSEARETEWTERFIDALLELAKRYGVPLAGGDTSESPTEHLLADVVLLGAVPQGTALRRSGARPGDALYVTGTLGGAAAELQALQKLRESRDKEMGSTGLPEAALSIDNTDTQPPAEHPQLYPEPRLRVGEVLREQRLATACMDVSDGLSTDLAQLCTASRLGAVVDWAALPASPWVQTLPLAQQEWAVLHGGEDYELLFTAAPETQVPPSIAAVPVARIGSMVHAKAGETPVRLRREGRIEALIPAGWEHLRG